MASERDGNQHRRGAGVGRRRVARVRGARAPRRRAASPRRPEAARPHRRSGPPRDTGPRTRDPSPSSRRRSRPATTSTPPAAAAAAGDAAAAAGIAAVGGDARGRSGGNAAGGRERSFRGRVSGDEREPCPNTEAQHHQNDVFQCGETHGMAGSADESPPRWQLPPPLERHRRSFPGLAAVIRIRGEAMTTMRFYGTLALLLPALAASTNTTSFGRRALLFGTIAEGAEPRAKGASDPLPIARRADPSDPPAARGASAGRARLRALHGQPRRAPEALGGGSERQSAARPVRKRPPNIIRAPPPSPPPRPPARAAPRGRPDAGRRAARAPLLHDLHVPQEPREGVGVARHVAAALRRAR